MKKLIMFSMVIAIAVLFFSGIASAQPVCFTICPPDASVDDEVTMTGYDEAGEFFDLSTLTIFESNFHGIGDQYYSLLKDGDNLTNIELRDGTVVFELIEDMLSEDVEEWDFFCVPGICPKSTSTSISSFKNSRIIRSFSRISGINISVLANAAPWPSSISSSVLT